MNKKELATRVAEVLRDSGIRKSVACPKTTYTISDADGNSKDFDVKAWDKRVLYTVKDVLNIIDASMEVLKDNLRRGEPTSIHGVGSIYCHRREARSVKNPVDGEWYTVPARFVPKLDFGKDLRMAAQSYGLMLEDRAPFSPPDPDDEDIADEILPKHLNGDDT